MNPDQKKTPGGIATRRLGVLSTKKSAV